MKQISILGCGWLGLPLAKSILEKGFSVKGSTTSVEKISAMEDSGIQSYLVTLSAVEVSEETKNSIKKFLQNSKILIINIPPKLRSNSSDTSTALSKTFVAKIQNLIPFIEKSSVEKVIFISSTSVYEDQPWRDENPMIYDENNLPNAQSESGKQLIETEKLLQANTSFETTVVRFGGLIGDDRHPIRSLAGRKNIENPDAPINLIHQVDCIGIIEKIIQSGLQQAQSDTRNENQVFHAVAPYHPTRKDYYTQKAIECNLPFPQFEEGKISVGKTITSAKVGTILDYKFQNTRL